MILTYLMGMTLKGTKSKIRGNYCKQVIIIIIFVAVKELFCMFWKYETFQNRSTLDMAGKYFLTLTTTFKTSTKYE